MPDSDDLDRCPFCDMVWGECAHVQLLLGWEAEAILREAQLELGSTATADELHQSAKHVPIPFVVPAGSSTK